MKKCVLVASLAGVLFLLLPTAASAATSNGRPTRASAAPHSTVRKSPKPPRRDQVQGGGLDGSITLIQFVSTRRTQDGRRQNRNAPPDSAAQVRASRDDAERENSTILTARAVDSLPPHWGATHLCI